MIRWRAPRCPPCRERRAVRPPFARRLERIRPCWGSRRRRRRRREDVLGLRVGMVGRRREVIWWRYTATRQRKTRKTQGHYTVYRLDIIYTPRQFPVMGIYASSKHRDARYHEPDDADIYALYAATPYIHNAHVGHFVIFPLAWRHTVFTSPLAYHLCLQNTSPPFYPYAVFSKNHCVTIRFSHPAPSTFPEWSVFGFGAPVRRSRLSHRMALPLSGYTVWSTSGCPKWVAPP